MYLQLWLKFMTINIARDEKSSNICNTKGWLGEVDTMKYMFTLNSLKCDPTLDSIFNICNVSILNSEFLGRVSY